MRISDWSSDVCSSDLFGTKRLTLDRGRPVGIDLHDHLAEHPSEPHQRHGHGDGALGRLCRGDIAGLRRLVRRARPPRPAQNGPEIGRASWRERVCQYVKISVEAVSLKKKNTPS